MFEPMLSASTMRSAASKLDAPSMADSLPSINFGFAELQARISAFQDQFDAFIATSRQRVLEERNQFRISLAAMEEEERRKKRDIDSLSQRTTEHERTLAQQQQETEALQREICDLTDQRDQALSNRTKLQQQLSTLKAEIAQREAAQLSHARDIEAQARHNTPELEFWQSALGLRIEGAGPDQLRFVFTQLGRAPDQASFRLDSSQPNYAVSDCTPKIESDQLEACVGQLNRRRELGPFLKQMRQAWVASDILNKHS